MTLYSQRDKKWKDKKFADGEYTFGQAGCLVVCLSMVASHYGREIEPDRLDEELKKVNGFSGALYIWNSLSKIFPQIIETKRVSTPRPVTALQFSEIDKTLSDGNLVIVEVDFIPETATVNSHFVVITGKSGNDYDIADPWTGTKENLEKYGVAKVTIQKYILFAGPMIDLEIFSQCFITQAYRWPIDPEKDSWKESHEAAYTWVQEHAPNPVKTNLEEEAVRTKDEIRTLNELVSNLGVEKTGLEAKKSKLEQEAPILKENAKKSQERADQLQIQLVATAEASQKLEEAWRIEKNKLLEGITGFEERVKNGVKVTCGASNDYYARWVSASGWEWILTGLRKLFGR